MARPGDFPSDEVLPWGEDSCAAREVIEVNVLEVLYCGIAAAKVMHAQGAISSGSSFGQRRAGAYSASKGAVASLT